MRVWLDDVRPKPEGFDVWAHDAAQAIDLLETGNVTHISLDHDLGDTEFHQTGYTVASAIEEWVFQGRIPMPTWQIHSANPVGRENMRMALYSAENFANGKKY